MKNFSQIIIALVMVFYLSSLHGQVAPSIEWQKSLGGSKNDEAFSIQQTSDGGFIVAGGSRSTDGNVSGNHGGDDYLIVKLDSAGSIVWQKSLGGSAYDYAQSVQQTTDGGFIVAGYSDSNDGDVSGNHLSSQDYWIVKLDADGSIMWEKSLGGGLNDKAYSIQQTGDEGFIVAGWSRSTDGDVSVNNGDEDYWIVKLDSTGSILWQKYLGGSAVDEATSVQQIFDGGFIIAGTSISNDSDVTGNHGESDYWIVKLDATGNLVWQKSLGGSADDEAYSVLQVPDGGFVVAGYSHSNDGDVSGNHPGPLSAPSIDYWIVKLNSAGGLVWQKCLGGSGDDEARSIEQTADGGFIIAGWSGSDDGDVTGHHFNTFYYDYWVVKLDSAGNLAWQKSLGGNENDYAYSAQQTMDTGFIVAGNSPSTNGDVTGNQGESDYWIVKLTFNTLSGIAPSSTDFTSIFPNPVETQLNINFATSANQISIRVYDLQGRWVALPITFENMQAQLNTTALPKGFYTLQIVNHKTGTIEVGKFVKQY